MISTEYKLVISSGHDDLVSKVNNFLSEGWVLQGGIAIVNEEEFCSLRETSVNVNYYYQALTRTIIK